MATTRPWRKVLYEDQGVPDNYVDASFLAQMRKNIYVREYRYWAVVVEAGSIQQQLCWNILFAVAFAHMYWESLQPWHLFYVLLAAAVVGYWLYRRLANPETPVADDLRTALLFVSILLALSPVLRTLTETISTDTIFAMAFFFFLGDMLFHNYGVDTAMVSKALSLNFALFAAICLTSRLPSNLHTFVLVSMAMLLFGLRPPLAQRLRAVRYPGSQVALTALLSGLAAAALASVSPALVLLFLPLSAALLFACPRLLVSMQRLKNNIYGPWDEAMVKE